MWCSCNIWKSALNSAVIFRLLYVAAFSRIYIQHMQERDLFLFSFFISWILWHFFFLRKTYRSEYAPYFLLLCYFMSKKYEDWKCAALETSFSPSLYVSLSLSFVAFFYIRTVIFTLQGPAITLSLSLSLSLSKIQNLALSQNHDACLSWFFFCSSFCHVHCIVYWLHVDCSIPTK